MLSCRILCCFTAFEAILKRFQRVNKKYHRKAKLVSFIDRTLDFRHLKQTRKMPIQTLVNRIFVTQHRGRNHVRVRFICINNFLSSSAWATCVVNNSFIILRCRCSTKRSINKAEAVLERSTSVVDDFCIALHDLRKKKWLIPRLKAMVMRAVNEL